MKATGNWITAWKLIDKNVFQTCSHEPSAQLANLQGASTPHSGAYERIFEKLASAEIPTKCFYGGNTKHRFDCLHWTEWLRQRENQRWMPTWHTHRLDDWQTVTRFCLTVFEASVDPAASKPLSQWHHKAPRIRQTRSWNLLVYWGPKRGG